jgi:hypothetical protein
LRTDPSQNTKKMVAKKATPMMSLLPLSSIITWLPPVGPWCNGAIVWADMGCGGSSNGAEEGF